MTFRLATRLLAASPFSLVFAAVAFAQTTPSAPEVSAPSAMAVSPALRELPASSMMQMPQQLQVVPPPRPLPPLPAGADKLRGEAVLQSEAAAGPAVATGASFAGITANGYVPGDPNLAVGPTQIVQVVNSEVAVFDKAGNVLSGPKKLGTIWTALGGNCATKNAGDVIAQYDRLADRWLISQLGSTKSPYSECIAVSTTNDATGSYFLYSYNFNRTLNDYPKFGIWPTASNPAYLAAYNLFSFGALFTGADLCAYDRTAMLAGKTATAICFTVKGGSGSYLPADLDGLNPPTAGSAGYFLDFNSSSSLRLYKLAPNFASPSSSKLTLATPDIAVASFTEACNGGSCIPQPLTTEQLDSLGDRLMYRLSYRNFGTLESMVVNHSIVAGSAVGVRWYELRATTPGTFSLFQQGTFAPDATYRWMGSAAMNGAGQIGLGYSVSSSGVYPGLAATARCSTTASGQMGPEAILQAGNGSQTGFTRWGDYSALRVDPSDDATFWYTNEYFTQTSASSWSTRIASFTVDTCP